MRDIAHTNPVFLENKGIILHVLADLSDTRIFHQGFQFSKNVVTIEPFHRVIVPWLTRLCTGEEPFTSDSPRGS
jgi:hypothetical protein